MTRRQEGWCVTGARRICERMRSLPHPTYMSTRVIHVQLFVWLVLYFYNICTCSYPTYMSTRVIHVHFFASLALYLYNIHVHIWHTCPLVSHMFASIIQYMSISTIHSIHVHLCHTCSVVRIVGIVLIKPAQKSDFWAKNQNFGPKKRHSLFYSNHVLATTGKSCSKKKSAFAQIIKGGNVILGDFLG